ncbi:MAG: 4-hydroxybenzoate octaprenyltransferase [Gammaproteobacteria bacterium]
MNVAVVKDRLHQYYRLTRLDRPIGSLLLLWPAMWALWIAGEGHPRPLIVAVFVLGVFIMRSAGCVLNDYADRHIDPHVKRTKARPLAAGQVSAREALTLFVVLSLLAFALVLLLNRLTVLMSFGGIVLAAVYPFTKRYTHLPQVFLGAAFGWAVPMAFAAQTGAVPKVGWLLFIAAILWAVVYDTMYAMVDRDDDLKIGVKSTDILFGDADRLIIGIVQIMLLGALVLAGRLVHLQSMYYLGLAVAAGLAVYQQYLIKGRERDKCFQAFLNNNWFGGVVFAGIVLHYMLISHI